MSATDLPEGVEQFGNPAPVARAFGWGSLGALAAFLIVNILNVGWGFASTADVLTGAPGSMVPLVIYLVMIGAGFYYSVRTGRNSLRWDAWRIHKFNAYLLRAFYFGILFTGITDATIAFFRIEKIFDLFMARDLVLYFQRSDFVGLYFHLPLIVLGFIVAGFTRTLGFIWLALLIIVAELAIVITRFIFSYEQAFMGDLVRYWYSALFLLASAYTLYEEGHVRVDVIYSGLRPRKKGLLNVLGVLFLGMPTAWTVIAVGFAGPQSIINSPIMNFEISQTGGIGMFIKYQMAAFLGIFGITMLIEFVVMLFESVADWRDEPGHRSYEISSQ